MSGYFLKRGGWYQNQETVPHVRGSETSKAAAESMRGHAQSIEERVMAYIEERGEHGATCDEVEIDLNLSHQTASARFSKLKRVGRIVATGKKRKTRSGRGANVMMCARIKEEIEARAGKTIDMFEIWGPEQ